MAQIKTKLIKGNNIKSILYLGTNSVVSESQYFVYNDTGLGIGVNSPTYKLDILGTSSTGLVRITQTSSGKTLIIEKDTTTSTSPTGLTNLGLEINVSGRINDNNYVGVFNDGSQGVDKVLTCVDGTGLARWSSPTPGVTGATGNGSLLSITELTANTLVTHTVPSGSNFTAINLNSDSTNRFAKITFTAPQSGNVALDMTFDMTIVNSGAVQMIGIHSSSASTTTPNGGWYRINADNDSFSGQFYAYFRLSGLTPSQSYSYYFMGVSDFSGNTIRASKQQNTSYVATSDFPAPLRITAVDLGNVSITTNPSS